MDPNSPRVCSATVELPTRNNQSTTPPSKSLPTHVASESRDFPGPFPTSGWGPDGLLNLGIHQNIIDNQGIPLDPSFDPNKQISNSFNSIIKSIKASLETNTSGIECNITGERPKFFRISFLDLVWQINQHLGQLELNNPQSINSTKNSSIEFIGGAIPYLLTEHVYIDYLATRFSITHDQAKTLVEPFLKTIRDCPNDFDCRQWVKGKKPWYLQNNSTFKNHFSNVVAHILGKNFPDNSPEKPSSYFVKSYAFKKLFLTNLPNYCSGTATLGSFLGVPLEFIVMNQTVRPYLFTRDRVAIEVEISLDQYKNLKIIPRFKFYPLPYELENGAIPNETVFFHQMMMLLDTPSFDGIDARGWLIGMIRICQGWRTINPIFFSSLWGVFADKHCPDNRLSMDSLFKEIEWSEKNHLAGYGKEELHRHQLLALQLNIFIYLIDHNQINSDDDIHPLLSRINELHQLDRENSISGSSKKHLNRSFTHRAIDSLLLFLNMAQHPIKRRLAWWRIAMFIQGSNHGISTGTISTNYGTLCYRLPNDLTERSVIWIPLQIHFALSIIEDSLKHELQIDTDHPIQQLLKATIELAKCIPFDSKRSNFDFSQGNSNIADFSSELINNTLLRFVANLKVTSHPILLWIALQLELILIERKQISCLPSDWLPKLPIFLSTYKYEYEHFVHLLPLNHQDNSLRFPSTQNLIDVNSPQEMTITNPKPIQNELHDSFRTRTPNHRKKFNRRSEALAERDTEAIPLMKISDLSKSASPQNHRVNRFDYPHSFVGLNTILNPAKWILYLIESNQSTRINLAINIALNLPTSDLEKLRNEIKLIENDPTQYLYFYTYLRKFDIFDPNEVQKALFVVLASQLPPAIKEMNPDIGAQFIPWILFLISLGGNLNKIQLISSSDTNKRGEFIFYIPEHMIKIPFIQSTFIDKVIQSLKTSSDNSIEMNLRLEILNHLFTQQDQTKITHKIVPPLNFYFNEIIKLISYFENSSILSSNFKISIHLTLYLANHPQFNKSLFSISKTWLINFPMIYETYPEFHEAIISLFMNNKSSKSEILALIEKAVKSGAPSIDSFDWIIALIFDHHKDYRSIGGILWKELSKDDQKTMWNSIATKLLNQHDQIPKILPILKAVDLAIERNKIFIIKWIKQVLMNEKKTKSIELCAKFINEHFSQKNIKIDKQLNYSKFLTLFLNALEHNPNEKINEAQPPKSPLQQAKEAREAKKLSEKIRLANINVEEAKTNLFIENFYENRSFIVLACMAIGIVSITNNLYYQTVGRIDLHQACVKQVHFFSVLLGRNAIDVSPNICSEEYLTKSQEFFFALIAINFISAIIALGLGQRVHVNYAKERLKKPLASEPLYLLRPISKQPPQHISTKIKKFIHKNNSIILYLITLIGLYRTVTLINEQLDSYIGEEAFISNCSRAVEHYFQIDQLIADKRYPENNFIILNHTKEIICQHGHNNPINPYLHLIGIIQLFISGILGFRTN
jgi:hypothetical protein